MNENIKNLLLFVLLFSFSAHAEEYTFTVKKDRFHRDLPHMYIMKPSDRILTPDRYSCRMRQNKKYCITNRGSAVTGRIVTSTEETISYETYQNGYQSGETLVYTLGGTLLQRCQYSKSEKNGEEITYYVNGNIFLIARYKNGMLNGKVTEYDINGHKVGQFNYKNGYFKGGYCQNERDNFSMKERLTQTKYNEIIPCQNNN